MACIVQPGSNGGFQKVFFGDEEIAIPVYGRCVATPCCAFLQERNSSGLAAVDACRMQASFNEQQGLFTISFLA